MRHPPRTTSRAQQHEEKRAWLAIIAGALGLVWFTAMMALTGWVATLR